MTALIRSFFILFLSLLSFSGLISCKDDPTSEFCDSGTPSCDGNVYSGVFENGMLYEIYLPDEYDETAEYPLMILNDGEVIFGSDSWKLDELLTTLISDDRIEPVIAVAVLSMGNRNNWYVPYEDRWVTENWGPYTPLASEYADVLINEILPELNEKYSINNDRIGIAGASLGGLLSTWAGLKYPDKFKYSASLSGSFWVADYAIFDEVSASYDNGQEFWFDIGTGEWNYYVPLYQALDEAGVEPGSRNFYFEDKDALHSDIYWSQRIEYPLLAFFGTVEPKPESIEILLECIPSFTQQGVKFRRMNPVITTSNGLKYSLAHTADYTLQSGSAELGTEGSFINDPLTEVQVLVEYMDFSEIVDIPLGFCR